MISRRVICQYHVRMIAAGNYYNFWSLEHFLDPFGVRKGEVGIHLCDQKEKKKKENEF